MRTSVLSKVLCCLLLCTVVVCKPPDPDRGCFAQQPLETIPWAKDQLARFQHPKSGPLRVVVYAYKQERFLAFENVFVSSPMSYIFDCDGKNIAQRGIRYNDFTDQARKLKVLLEGSY